MPVCEAELFLNLRGDQHAVAENLVLNLSEPSELGGCEDCECPCVVAVDECEEALVLSKSVARGGLALEERLGAGFQLLAKAVDLCDLIATEAEVRADAGHFHEQGHRARIIGRTGCRMQRG